MLSVSSFCAYFYMVYSVHTTFLAHPIFFYLHHTNSYLSFDTQVMHVRWDSSLSPQVGVGTLLICCHRL